MPLTQNVSGTLKKITKLTQNVSGTLKPLTSLKQNVSGTLKEVFSWSSLPTSLTWTADNGAIAASNVTIQSESNNGLTVSARLYNGGYNSISSSNFSAAPKIYSNTFYLSAGNTVTISGTFSSEQTNPSSAQLLLYLYNVDTDKLYSVSSKTPYEITVSGNYYIIITGFTFIATGSASGVSYSYGYVNVGGTVSFANSIDDAGEEEEETSETVATFTVVRTEGVVHNPSTTSGAVTATSGWSATYYGGSSATGQTGYTYTSSLSLSSFTVKKACSISISGQVTGNGSVTAKIQGVSYSLPFTQQLSINDSVTISASASWGYTTGGTYSITITLK